MAKDPLASAMGNDARYNAKRLSLHEEFVRLVGHEQRLRKDLDRVLLDPDMGLTERHGKVVKLRALLDDCRAKAQLVAERIASGKFF